MSRIAIVVAISRKCVIGRDGGLPWHISSDLQRFKAITMGKPIIMGRKTWESLPRKPLPGRQNIVITRQKNFVADGALVAGDLNAAIALAGGADEICIIGGGDIYRQALPLTDRLYLTEVDMDVEGDTRFPDFDPNEWREVAFERQFKGPRDSAGFTLRTLDRQG